MRILLVYISIAFLISHFVTLNAADIKLSFDHTTETTPETVSLSPIIGTVIPLNFLGIPRFSFSVVETTWDMEASTGVLSRSAGAIINLEEPTQNLPATITVNDSVLSVTVTKTFNITIDNVNEPPTVISFTPSIVFKENTLGAVSGTLYTTDPDANDNFVYTVSDARFEVIGNTLKLLPRAALDLESEPVVHLTVTARDVGGLPSTPLELKLDLNVINVNEAPTAIDFNPSTLLENNPGAVAGTLSTVDPDAADTFIYTVSDPRFYVTGNTLVLMGSASLNRETEPTVTLTITARDAGGLPNTPLTRTVVLHVGNVNEPPTAITLTPGGPLFENTDSAVVGILNIVDPDPGDIFVSSVSDPRFEVVNSVLKLRSGNFLDFETDPIIHLAVSTRDIGGLPATALILPVTLTVHDVNEAPTAITLTPSATPFFENTPRADAGTLSAVDPDANDFFIYSVSDTRFEVINNHLLLATWSSIDFEKEPSIHLVVTCRDSGNLAAPPLNVTINVSNLNEPPTAITFVASHSLFENTPNAVAGTLGVSDPDAGDSFTYKVTDPRFEILKGTTTTLKLVDPIVGKNTLDYETQPSLVLAVIVNDAAGETFTQNITLTTIDMNDPPTVPSWANVQLAVIDASKPLPLAGVADVVADEDLHNAAYFDFHGFSLQLSHELGFSDHLALDVPKDLASLYVLRSGGVYLKGSTSTHIAGYQLSDGKVTITIDDNRPSTLAEFSNLLRLIVFTADPSGLDKRFPLALKLSILAPAGDSGWTGTRMLHLDTANLPPTMAPQELTVTRFSQMSITPAMLGIADEHAELGLTLFIDYPTFSGKLYTAEHSRLLGPNDQVPITYITATGALLLDLIYVPDSGTAATADTCFLSVKDHGGRADVTSDSWLQSLPSKVSFKIEPGNVPMLTILGESIYTEGGEAVTLVPLDTKLELKGTKTPLDAILGGWNFYISYTSLKPSKGPSTASEQLGIRIGNGISIGDDGRTVMLEGRQIAQIEATATGSTSALVFVLSSGCLGGDVLKLATAVTYRDTSLRLPLAGNDPQAVRTLYLGFINKTDPDVLADAFATVKRTGIDNPPVFSEGTQRTIITVSNEPLSGSTVIDDIDNPDTPTVLLKPISGGTATVHLTRGPIDTGATYRTTLDWKITRDATSGNQDFDLIATFGSTSLTQRLTLSPRSGSDLSLAIVSDAPLALIKPLSSANPLQRAVRVRRGAEVVTDAAVYLLGEKVPSWVSVDSTAGTVGYDLADAGAVIGQTYRFSLLATTATSAAEQPVILRVVGPTGGSGSN